MFSRLGFPLRAIGILTILGALLGWSSAHAHDVHDGEQTDDAASAGHPTDDIHELIRRFRQTGDDEHLDVAWSHLEPLLADGTQDVVLLIDAATVAQSRHDFAAALAVIDRALFLQPGFDQAWLLRASIELVRGNAAEAQAACNQLRSVPALIAVTCRARVQIARGEQQKALRALDAVLTAVDRASAEPEALARALSVAGDAAATLDPDKAIDYYRHSLELVESTQVRAALVDVLLRTDRVPVASSVVASGHDALPLTVRRLLIAVRTGETDRVADEITRMDHEFRHWIADKDWAHAREMARFYIDVLDRPELARRLVRINLGIQREPEDLLLARRLGE